MLWKDKNAKKLQYYIITGPKLGGGGVRGASVKSQSITFIKPSLLENGTKIVQRRVVLLKYMFLLSLRTHESMEIQFSTDGIHQKWPYWQPTWDQKVISAPFTQRRPIWNQYFMPLQHAVFHYNVTGRFLAPGSVFFIKCLLCHESESSVVKILNRAT